MSKNPCPTAIALGLMLAGCSQSSGIPQVDRVKERVEAEVGMTQEIRPVADAADRAVRAAGAASATRDPAKMAAAVGTGTADVLCAGVKGKVAVANRLGTEFDKSIPEGDAKRTAIDAYKATTDLVPAIPTPCD